MRRGSKAHSWALTRTDVQGQTYPPLSSLFVSRGVSGFQRSLHEDCLLCSSPHPPARASSNAGMPSRQLCGGSCLGHLKADGWAWDLLPPPQGGRRRHCSFGLGTGRDRWTACLDTRTWGMGVGGHHRQRGSSGQPPGGPLSKGQDSALHLLRGAPALTPQPHHLSGQRGPTPAPCTS